jgi:hypothetical protein
MSEVKKELYTRENLESFFKWKDDSALFHFPEELHCEERASEYACKNPRTDGFLVFKSKYKGKRYFWVEKGESYELDPVECFLKVRDMKYNRAKEMIQKKLFKKGLPPENPNKIDRIRAKFREKAEH